MSFREGLFDPTYTGKLSQSVDESKQGKLQGVNQSLQSANRNRYYTDGGYYVREIYASNKGANFTITASLFEMI